MEKLQWSMPEYDERDRSSDWFWALGVIVVAGAIASIIYENYFFATLIVLSGILLTFFAKRKPEMVTYELNNKGLKIHDLLYPYVNIKAFWIQLEDPQHANKEEHVLKPLLFIKSQRFFIPIITIPIEMNMAEDIHTVLSSRDVPEEEMQEHLSEKIIEFLGF